MATPLHLELWATEREAEARRFFEPLERPLGRSFFVPQHIALDATGKSRESHWILIGLPRDGPICYKDGMANDDAKPSKVHPVLSAEMHEILERLVKKGPYGTSKTQVAQYLIQRGVDDLVRAHVIKLDD